MLEVYNVLRETAESQDIPFIEILNEIMANQTTPKKVRKKKTEKSSTEIDYPEKPTVKKSVGDCKFLCDTMLAGLGKQLRKYGIDTVILENGERPSAKLQGQTFVKDELSIVTRPSKYRQFLKYGVVYGVKSDNVKEQLAEVLDFFNIEVTENDIFTRCMVGTIFIDAYVAACFCLFLLNIFTCLALRKLTFTHVTLSFIKIQICARLI